MHFKAKILVFILLVGNLLRVGRPYKLSKKKRYSFPSLYHLHPARTELTVSHSASIYACILFGTYMLCYACKNLSFICTIAECTTHLSFLSFAIILCTLTIPNQFYTRQALISLVVSRWLFVFSCGANYNFKASLGLIETFLTEIPIFFIGLTPPHALTLFTKLFQSESTAELCNLCWRFRGTLLFPIVLNYMAWW